MLIIAQVIEVIRKIEGAVTDYELYIKVCSYECMSFEKVCQLALCCNINLVGGGCLERVNFIYSTIP